jgi:6-phosphogluconolactonase
MLFTANHGDFDHVEHVVKGSDGTWSAEYLYDDSTVVQFGLELNGSLAAIQDLKLFNGHGKDPNTSPQVAGHGQASPHAHCAVIDPSGKYLVVCDKATDQIYVFQFGLRLALVSSFQLPEQIGPRHAAFDPVTHRMYVTCEFSSELASFDFDADIGELHLVHKVSTLDPSYTGHNEPAEVRSHPHGGFVYVNNRGEDSVAWFRVDDDGQLTRAGHVSIAKSIHPGLAARSFAFAPSGGFILVADRPGNLSGHMR